MSDETKKKLSEDRKQKYINGWTPRVGKHHSEESKQKIRVATMGNKNPFYGQTHSKKTKEKLRTTQTGRIWSDEHKQKLSEVRKIQFGGKRPDYLKRTVPFSIEAIEKMKTSALNREKKECPHCGLVCAPNTAKRWHFDQCKKLGL
jgi:ribosomal protein S27AE